MISATFVAETLVWVRWVFNLSGHKPVRVSLESFQASPGAKIDLLAAI